MSKVTYNVIYQVCGQVTADIPDDITTREEAVAYLEKNWKNMPFPKTQSISVTRKNLILKAIS